MPSIVHQRKKLLAGQVLQMAVIAAFEPDFRLPVEPLINYGPKAPGHAHRGHSARVGAPKL